MARLFSSDPVTRTKRLFHYDESSDQVVIETVQDVEGIIDSASAQYNAFPHKSSQKFKGDGFHHVGSIPMPVLMEIMRTCEGDEYAVEQAVKLWLNDPDNRKFRTMPGVI